MPGPAPLLLLSMPQMADPNFARSVVLLCDYTERGAFGLIVNRQMDEFAHAVVKTDPNVRVDPELRLFVGGPVDAHSTWIVMAEAQGPDDEQREVCPGVLLSVSRRLTLELLQSPPSNRARVVVGCAVWGPGPARCRDCRIVVADDGRGSVADLRRAARADVGDGDSTSRHRSRKAAGQFRSALRRAG